MAATTMTIPRTGKLGSRSSSADNEAVRTRYTTCDEASLLCAENEDAAISGVRNRHYRSMLPPSSDTLALRLAILWEKLDFASTRDLQKYMRYSTGVIA